ncbi:hypothetical protein V2J09_002369 [Rumex salicifolius]
MVVDLIKWMAWPPLNSKNYEASIRVRSVKGAGVFDDRDYHSRSPWSSGGRCPGLMVEIRWKGSTSNGFIGLSKKVKRNFTREEAVDQNGVVAWEEEFKKVCTFSGSSSRDGFNPWEIAFIVIKASDRGQMNKPVVAGPAFLNLADFASIEKEQELEISVPLTQSSSFDWFVTLSITLHLKELKTNKETPMTFKRSFTSPLSAPLLPFLRKAKSVREFVWLSRRKSKKAYRVEAINDGKLSSGSESFEENCSFDIYSLDHNNNKASLLEDSKEVYDNVDQNSFGYGTLITANTAGRLFYMKTSCKDEDLVYHSNSLCTDDMVPEIPELTLKHSPKLPKLKRKISIKPEKVRGEPLLNKEYGEMGGDDLDFIRRQLCTSDVLSARGDKTEALMMSEFGDDSFTVGSWEYIEVVSRDGSLKLQTQVFFATIDQRSEKAAGESACTALVVVLAHWLHSNRNQMPNKSELDSLIREGSLQWRKLCEYKSLMTQFPDKHFDLETVIQADICPISVASTTGFFHPGEMENEGLLEYLDGSRSFDCIWDEISMSKSDPLIYIISWNDHFFVLKIEADAFYVIDTLGERLQEGCSRAFVLKFDKKTTICKIPDKEDKKCSSSVGNEGKDSDAGSGTEVEDRFVCVGKEACKEYIKSFLAAIPIRELQSDIKEGRRRLKPLHELLQIDIHYTELHERELPW